MSEFETDPQRRPANADRELSATTAELPRDDRGQAAESPRQDGGQSAAGGSGAGDIAPVTPTGDTTPAPPAAGGWSAATTATGVPPAEGATRDEAYAAPRPPAMPTPPPGQPYPEPGAGQPYARPAAASPYSLPPTGHPASPWQPPQQHAQHQPGWPSHPTSGPGGLPPQPPYGGPVPPWGGPAAPGGGSPTGRFGKIVAIGAVALALMAGSGIAGGAVALTLDDSRPVATKTFNAAPVINPADLPAIAERVQPSVVSISTSSTEGSGVVMNTEGYILTNNHVVASATGNTVRVFFADGTNAAARIVGTDPKTDLAVVRVENASGLTPAQFGDSDAMRVGDTVLALGSPLGLQGSVTAGIISARDRTIQTGGENGGSPFGRPRQGASSISGLLQTDAPINPGNSGGALVNTRGEVIGINTAILTAGQGNGNIGVGFAIPSNKATSVAEALQRGEKVSHPSLGVSVSTAENGGALVGGVVPDSPAAKAGIQQGDVIVQFGDRPINDSDDLVAAVQAGRVGDQVQVTYTRNGVRNTATVTLAEAS